MSAAHPEPEPGTTSRRRLRRTGRKMVRVGGLLLAIALVVTLIGGLGTRSLLTNLQTNSAELLDGSGTVELAAGNQRTLYVTGGLITPGEIAPTPVEEITCTVEGPSGQVPVDHLRDQDKSIGVDLALARFQVVGDFRAAESGQHTITCTGLGVVVAPEVGLASAILRLGSLALGSLGVFAGATLLLIGAALRLFAGRGDDDPDDLEDEDLPPEDGAEKWWEEGSAEPHADGRSGEPADERARSDSPVADDLYVDLTEEELDALSEDEIAELVASGALVFVDEDDELVHRPDEDDDDHGAARSDTYR